MSTLLLCLVSLVTLQEPPAGQPTLPRGQGNAGIMPPGQTPQGFGSNVMVDGTYVVLAYDKFGQSLPGMANVKVVIRGNILIFPGDAKLPGKMLQLAFGPNNTITVTPIEGIRKDATGNNNNSASPWPDPSKDPNGVTQTGGTMNAATEMGVYVLSNEYFSISIAGRQSSPPMPPGNVPPGTTPPTVPPGTPIRKPDGAVGNGPVVGNQPANPTTPSFPIQPPAGNTSTIQTGARPTMPSQAVLVLKRVAQ